MVSIELCATSLLNSEADLQDHVVVTRSALTSWKMGPPAQQGMGGRDRKVTQVHRSTPHSTLRQFCFATRATKPGQASTARL